MLLCSKDLFSGENSSNLTYLPHSFAPSVVLFFTDPTSILPQTHGNFSFLCFRDLLQSVLHFHIATAFNSSQSKQLIFFSELVNSVAHRSGGGGESRQRFL